MNQVEQPATIEELQRFVCGHDRVRVVGGGSKSGLATRDDSARRVGTTAFNGLMEYEPTEFTFTAQAGTLLSVVERALADEGQYLPFDPPLVAAGATLGGTVAGGLSGPGRFAYGGVRDFILGARLVNGQGDLVYGGGKVVKNAAGFDIPKLNVGALGRYGVLVELTFKVFPLPERFFTFQLDFASRNAALAMMNQLARSPLELKSLDYEPPGRLWLRFGGRNEAFEARRAAFEQWLADTTSAEAPQLTVVKDDAATWTAAREFTWLGESDRLVKIPITPSLIEPLEAAFGELQRSAAALQRRYSVGGNLLWLAWPAELMTETLEDLLRDLNLSGLAVLGDWPRPLLGASHENVFESRLRQVFDPAGKFSDIAAPTT